MPRGKMSPTTVRIELDDDDYTKLRLLSFVNHCLEQTSAHAIIHAALAQLNKAELVAKM